MAIDYSKWDKIELSDDSDIEVHPNVDKRSFIKWKQRDIHEKRHQRNIEIKSILVQLTMYAKLNERVDYLLKTLSNDEILQDSVVMQKLNAEFAPSEKFDYEKLKEAKGDSLRKGLRDLQFAPEEIENTPPYNEMIEDLFIQVKEDHPDAKDNATNLIRYIKEHRAKIDDVLSKQTIRLDELLHEKANLISSDDIHTGFDRSFMNRDQEEKKNTEASTEKKTVVETINTPLVSASDSKPLTTESQPVVPSESGKAKDDDDDFDELYVMPATAEFAKFSVSSLEQSASFLIKHTEICTEHQKNALLMTAFDHQLEGDEKTTKQVIHQAILIQYAAYLSGPNPAKDKVIQVIKVLFGKLNDNNSPAYQAFKRDVDENFNHIKGRCEVIKKEQAQEAEADGEEAVIQLKALDEGTELFVNIPKEGTPEYDVFSNKLPQEMQEAVKTGSLEEVNNLFAKMKVEEAEQILEVFNECAVIGINGYLENEDEFKELQKQYNDETNSTEKIVEEDEIEEDEGDEEVDTADIVD